jgi:hypothetical protein
MIKLAVGARDVADIVRHQSGRTSPGTPVIVPTRQYPSRAAELVDGGSLFWVVAGLVSVRQPIVDIRAIRREDGTRGTHILLRPELVPVELRPVRAFQGWRYLRPDEAAADLTPGAASNDLPLELRRRLAALSLL